MTCIRQRSHCAQAIAAAACPLAAVRLSPAAAAVLQARLPHLAQLVAALEALPSPAAPPAASATDHPALDSHPGAALPCGSDQAMHMW